MPRTPTEVNCAKLQQIIDKEEKTCDNIGQMKFFEHCAKIYNQTYGGNVTASVIYIRFKQNLIHANIVGKRGPGKLTDAHKAAMQEGRKREHSPTKNPPARCNDDELKSILEEIHTHTDKRFKLNFNNREKYGALQTEETTGPSLHRNNLKWYLVGILYGLGGGSNWDTKRTYIQEEETSND